MGVKKWALGAAVLVMLVTLSIVRFRVVHAGVSAPPELVNATKV